MAKDDGKPNRASYADRKAFIEKLPLLMDEAGRLGLFKTMHKLHEAVRQSGYELAEHDDFGLAKRSKKQGEGNG